jgi:hypothetical protein
MVHQATLNKWIWKNVESAPPDRWFHITFPKQYGDELDKLKTLLEKIAKDENTRYLLVTTHDEQCKTKSLNASVTPHPHYHAIIWLVIKKTARQISTLFHLYQWKKPDGSPQYYCSPKYSTSTMSGFIGYVSKYQPFYESGTLPARVLVERANPLPKTPASESERRMATAINWVRKGLDEIYRKMDPVHYTRNYAKIKSLWGTQQHFTADKREFENYWITGPPGTGKSAILAALWPGAYALRDQYWDGFNPRSNNHRVVTLKDINSKWILDYGITAMKVLCDKDGHNINVKYAGGEMVNHGRIIITSNHGIYDCVAGTCKDEIVGLDKEVQALQRRYKEITIDDFLKMSGRRLKSKEELAGMKGQQVEDYNDLFEIIGPNEIPGYGEEPYLISLVSEPESDDEDAE